VILSIPGNERVEFQSLLSISDNIKRTPPFASQRKTTLVLRFAARLEKEIGLLHSVLHETAQISINPVLANSTIKLPDAQAVLAVIRQVHRTSPAASDCSKSWRPMDFPATGSEDVEEPHKEIMLRTCCGK
jgi:hypothetical protein